jgi:hypothetical protein
MDRAGGGCRRFPPVGGSLTEQREEGGCDQAPRFRTIPSASHAPNTRLVVPLSDVADRLLVVACCPPPSGCRSVVRGPG